MYPAPAIFRRACGYLTAGIGALVLLGWLAHWPTIVQVRPHFAPMQPATALGFVLLGAHVAHPRRWMGYTVLALGAWILAGIYVGVPGPGDILPKPWNVVETPNPGSPAPNTGACFALMGLAYLARRHLRTAIFLIALCATVALWSLIGYYLGVPLFDWGLLYTSMAIHTAVAFMLASAGSWLAHEKGGAE